MKYEEFCKSIIEMLPSYLDKVEVLPGSSVRNNSVRREGVILKEPGKQISPMIFLEEYYEDYEKGKTTEKICEELSELYGKLRISSDREEALEGIYNYEQIKGKVVVRLTGIRENLEKLEGIPYTRVDDLAATYHIRLADNDEYGIVSIPVTNELFNSWGISLEEIHEAALANTQSFYPLAISKLDSFIEIEGAGLVPKAGVLVVSNIGFEDGAVAVLYPGALSQIQEEIGDYYMIPSSVHEWFALPKDTDISEAEFGRMIREVNEISVLPEERLSDHLYEYDPKEEKIKTVENSLPLRQTRQMRNEEPKL